MQKKFTAESNHSGQQSDQRLSDRLEQVRETYLRQFIEVEKMLCDVLGREWRPTGFSIVTLIADIKARLARAEANSVAESSKRGISPSAILSEPNQSGPL